MTNKLAKTSYGPFAQKYGPGYLVVNVNYPMYDRRAHQRARELWDRGRPWKDLGHFREIVLRIRVFRGYRFQTWSP